MRFIWKRSIRLFAPHGHVFDRDARLERADGVFQYVDQRAVSAGPSRRSARRPSWRRRKQAFRKLASGQIKPLPGLMTLLALADRADVPMVAVTNAPRLNAEMMLSGLGIMQRFKAVDHRRRASARQAASDAIIWKACAR